ncbi:acyltransferase family protein [Sphingomonas sp. OK281]|uniref:acyltransferase family protein n=1 Tax=Sphingomonas sp. OK281 TaxID=1881067 RepID=UPI0008E4DA0A|nr:acyltransferase family protein [Sphingomonas sp. OK281]SFO10830.1 Peptidoglycan/LPS O-acetylase OafA/YrhL, contains acyltransferase and SGNH-hydrolase domains [Sphingomonas sp. OK281]
MKYRSEIDGLRAIAVIPVILFHSGSNLFKGGFVGVDIFFVISGYLITSIMAYDLDNNRFSIIRFYERRARRILPALFVVILVCIPFAWLLLMPGDLKDFAKSIIAVCLFASNIFFWRSSGYFDAETAGKPLLHTWSLAVEEQYYVLFPIALLVLWRFGRRPTFYLIFFVAALSLLLSEWGWRHQPSANFYLAPTRAWELLVGSMSALWHFNKPQRSNGPLAALGLAMIAFAIFAYDETTPFPSVYALVPVIGTGLILLFAGADTLTGRLLSLRPFVWIGLISYSAYLWHQPIFAFARHYRMGPLPTPVGLALSALAIGLAYLSYRFVETPFRQSKTFGRKQIFAFSAVGLAGFAAVGASGVTTNGGMYRFYDTPERAVFAKFFENASPGLAYVKREEILAKVHYDCDSYDLASDLNGAQTNVAKPSIPSSCFVRTGRKAVLIWGDSHAMALRPGLTRNLPADWQVLQVASSACPAEIVDGGDRSNYCRFSNALAMKTVVVAKPDTVIVAQKDGHSLDRMYAIRRYLESAGVRNVLFVGPSPHWRYDLPNIILRSAWENTPRYLKTGLNTDTIELDRSLKTNFKADPYSRYVSLIDLFCTARGCLSYIGGDKRLGITTYDYGHLSLPASNLVSRKTLVDKVIHDPGVNPSRANPQGG